MIALFFQFNQTTVLNFLNTLQVCELSISDDQFSLYIKGIYYLLCRQQEVNIKFLKQSLKINPMFDTQFTRICFALKVFREQFSINLDFYILVLALHAQIFNNNI